MVFASLVLLVSCGPRPVVPSPATASESVAGSYYYFDLDDEDTSDGVEISLSAGSGTRNIFLLFTNPGTQTVSAPSATLLNAVESRSSQPQLPQSRSPLAPATGGPVVRDAVIPREWEPVLGAGARGLTVEPPSLNSAPPGPGSDTIGETRTFYGINYDDTDPDPDENAPVVATLRAVEGVPDDPSEPSLSIYVEDSEWEDDPEGIVNGAMVSALQEQFLDLTGTNDDIYEWVSALYGAPWSGGLSASLTEFNNNVTILVHDIETSTTGDGPGGIVGYFWSKDNFLNSALAPGQPTSNERIMFYLDSETLAARDGFSWEITDYWPEIALSTLAHEFQHMIHFHQRDVLSGTSTPVWMNELMSLVTEDVVADKLGIDGPRGVDPSEETVAGDAGVTGTTAGRLPLYNYWNDISLSGWGSTGDVLDSYAISYAFGAYLARNYGGAGFLKALMDSGSADPYQMIVDATGRTIEDHMWRWGVATLRSDTALSPPFRLNPGTWVSSSAGGTSFNLGSINHYNYRYTDGLGNELNGPWIYGSLDGLQTMPAASKLIYYAGTVADGQVDISVSVPSGVDMTVVVE